MTDQDLWRTVERARPAPAAAGLCATLSEHGLRCGC